MGSVSQYTQPSIQRTSIQRISNSTDSIYYWTGRQDLSKSLLLFYAIWELAKCIKKDKKKAHLIAGFLKKIE